jgi:hypothetical protein
MAIASTTVTYSKIKFCDISKVCGYRDIYINTIRKVASFEIIET